MKFNQIKKDMILKFAWSSSEYSYFYILNNDRIISALEIKVFTKKEELNTRSIEIDENAWDHPSMAYSRYKELDNEESKKIIDYIFRLKYMF